MKPLSNYGIVALVHFSIGQYPYYYEFDPADPTQAEHETKHLYPIHSHLP